MAAEPFYAELRREWVDAWRYLHPVRPGNTYPHGTEGPPNKLARPGFAVVRPDLAMLRPSVRPLSMQVLAAGGSDHRPLLLRLAY